MLASIPFSVRIPEGHDLLVKDILCYCRQQQQLGDVEPTKSTSFSIYANVGCYILNDKWSVHGKKNHSSLVCIHHEEGL
jgi:hypothetical protein